MNFIDQLALKSAEFTATNLSDNSAIEQVIRKHKNKDVSLNKEDTISVLAYGFTALYGEIFKSIIVLFISLLFYIFIPTFVVMLSFSIMRAFIGGKHLHSSGKCLIFTSQSLMIQ